MSNKRSRLFVDYEMKILAQNYSNGNLEMLMRIKSCKDGKVGEVGKIKNLKWD